MARRSLQKEKKPGYVFKSMRDRRKNGQFWGVLQKVNMRM